MLMMLISLVISLAPVQTLLPLRTQADGSSQVSQQVQQDKKDSTRSTYVLNELHTLSVRPIPLPEGDNAWAVQIVSSGGITGSGRGNVTLTSDGYLLRFGPSGSCRIRLSDETIQELTKTVFAATGSHSVEGRTARLVCPDCYVTAMVVTRRRVSGDETTIAASWHDASEATVAADLLIIYQAVMANKDCKLQ